jgi:hypothetical protein
VPVLDANGNLVADADNIAGNAVPFNPQTGANLAYDNELLDAHYIAGDGRVNENIGLTSVQPSSMRSTIVCRSGEGHDPP